MISTFTALIDANVFFGARLRSLFLHMAQTKMFRARWSARINDEWMRNVASKHNLDISKLHKTRDLMTLAVPDCLVEGYEQIETGLILPDQDDRHVVAAAVLTRADVIVTFNIKDFPSNVLEPLRLEARHPDQFLQDLFGISSDLFIEAVKKDFDHYKSPKLEFSDYVTSLTKAGVPAAAKLIEELRVVIAP